MSARTERPGDQMKAIIQPYRFLAHMVWLVSHGKFSESVDRILRKSSSNDELKNARLSVNAVAIASERIRSRMLFSVSYTISCLY
jgi:hypothetical protein